MTEPFYKEIPREIDHASQFQAEFLRSGQISKYPEFQNLRRVIHFMRKSLRKIDHVSQFLAEFLRSGQISKYREFQKR